MKIHQLMGGDCISLLGFEQIQAILECGINNADSGIASRTRLRGGSNIPKSWNSTWNLKQKDFPVTLCCPNFPDKAIFELSLAPDTDSTSNNYMFALKRLNQPLIGGIPVQKKPYDIKITIRLKKEQKKERFVCKKILVGEERRSFFQKEAFKVENFLSTREQRGHLF